ncbi:MAG: hypothetical protein WA741_34070, partial [Candidatus Sulfotelmatobacter sp.]
PCQAEIKTVGNGGERSMMTAHQLGCAPHTAGVKLDCADFLFPDDPICASGYVTSASEVAVSK